VTRARNANADAPPSWQASVARAVCLWQRGQPHGGKDWRLRPARCGRWREEAASIWRAPRFARRSRLRPDSSQTVRGREIRSPVRAHPPRAGRGRRSVGRRDVARQLHGVLRALGQRWLRHL